MNRWFWGILPGILSAALTPAFAGNTASSKPNIIVIMADDMGFSDIGCYGSEIDTPHLDRLAAQGLRFTQFYNTARCCPTRASLLTGLYAHQAGVGHMIEDRGYPAYRGNLSPHCPTVAELLKPAGYRTALSGKWHVTPLSAGKENWPLQRGFDKFFGLIGSVRSYYAPSTLTRDHEPIEASKGFYLTDAITDHAVSCLKEFSQEKAPFFLYVAYTAPHWPMHALPEDIAKYRGKYKIGWDQLRRQRHARLQELGLIGKDWPLSPRDTEALPWEEAEHRDWQDLRMAVYAAMIDRMDQGIGRILRQLKDSKQEENTLILFLSDNGGCAEDIIASWSERFPRRTHDGQPVQVGNDPAVSPGPEGVFQSYGLAWANASNTPFRRFKHWVHEGGIATPCIAYWPAVIQKPGITHQVGHVIDIPATCLDLAGVAHPKTFKGQPTVPLEGRSLLPILQGKERAGHDALFWEHEGNRAVRQGKWKLVSAYGGDWELFDLEADRTELNDLARREPDKVKELSQLYERWAKRVGVVPWEKLQEKR
ncbi:MAG: arylsulfatase [Gemmataceae bacterium]